ncbi:MAG TPA: methylated-DNA--[protein]-cysteine S-methyltransferase [Burkholderiaceae bacterium]|nr:methylated-DNA--[protein]-cysteine S-methyltransferase [Burkholderiaceae bacterium]
MSVHPVSSPSTGQSAPMPSPAWPVVQVATGPCWLGALAVAHTHAGVCAILFGDTTDALREELAQRFSDNQLALVDPDHHDTALAAVQEFLDDPSRPFRLELDMHGTPFQRRVWQALLTIPVGTTTTYTDLARQIGAPNSVRAVANACGANLLAGVVPCHRVIRRDGTLSGYRCGIERKRQLLAHEARITQPILS